MLQQIMIQTPEGVKEYPFAPTGDAYEAAIAAGEIHIGDEIVYRNMLMLIVEDYEMLLLEKVQMDDPVFCGGIGPQFAPAQDAAGAFNPGVNWSFTVNGVPLTPEQMQQFMGGGPMGN